MEEKKRRILAWPILFYFFMLFFLAVITVLICIWYIIITDYRPEELVFAVLGNIIAVALLVSFCYFSIKMRAFHIITFDKHQIIDQKLTGVFSACKVRDIYRVIITKNKQGLKTLQVEERGVQSKKAIGGTYVRSEYLCFQYSKKRAELLQEFWDGEIIDPTEIKEEK